MIGCLGGWNFMVDLLKHNQEAFQEISKKIDSGIKKIE